jgi:hypothetical protein
VCYRRVERHVGHLGTGTQVGEPQPPMRTHGAGVPTTWPGARYMA